MEWDEAIRARYTDWMTDAALAQWPQVRERLQVDQQICGTVIARAAFGGALDVLDSVLAAAPVAYCLWAAGVVGP